MGRRENQGSLVLARRSRPLADMSPAVGINAPSSEIAALFSRSPAPMDQNPLTRPADGHGRAFEGGALREAEAAQVLWERGKGSGFGVRRKARKREGAGVRHWEAAMGRWKAV